MGGVDVERVVTHVRQQIDLANAKLGDEFYAAHLSVALIDAVFSARLKYCSQVLPIIDRYCDRFGLHRIRPDRLVLPSVDDQDTLADLIGHYETLGPDGIQEQVFRSRYISPGTHRCPVLKSENVRRSAIELRQIGIDTLQDALASNPEAIKSALRPLYGIGGRTIHMFLMYAGGDEFVKGDVHVCRFVARALQRRKVSVREAESVVSEAAVAIGVAPRVPDYEIWSLEASPKLW